MPLDPQVAAFYGDCLNVLPDMSAVTVAASSATTPESWSST